MSAGYPAGRTGAQPALRERTDSILCFTSLNLLPEYHAPFGQAIEHEVDAFFAVVRVLRVRIRHPEACK
ncbi:MAG: hypothetical protein V3U39_11060 [Acidimicrobiia bacterium]